MLLGRGGSRKRELEDQSGVSLHITDSDGEGLVEIRGPSEEACSKAEETISNITRFGSSTRQLSINCDSFVLYLPGVRDSMRLSCLTCISFL